MSNPMLNGAELLQWCDETMEHWFALLKENPAILALPCDIAPGVTTVAQLMQHIVAVPLRYALQLQGKEPESYDKIPYGSVEELRATHVRARTMYEELLKLDTPWDEVIDVVTRSAGTFRVPRRKIFLHAHLHTIRHSAQLATLVRQHGCKPDWLMDFLASGSM